LVASGKKCKILQKSQKRKPWKSDPNQVKRGRKINESQEAGNSEINAKNRGKNDFLDECKCGKVMYTART
jgi:hypothetical protein